MQLRARIQDSDEQVAAADLILLVLDATRPLTAPEQSPLLKRYGADARARVVLNKCDVVATIATDDPGHRVDVRTCAVSGHGIDELRSAILSHFRCAGLDPDRPRVWTERQREIIRRSRHNPDAISEL